MKKLFVICISLFSFSLLAGQYNQEIDHYFSLKIDGQVQNIVITNHDNHNNLVEIDLDKICILYIMTPDGLLGIVEDIYSCFWTKSMQHKIGTNISIHFEYLTNIKNQDIIYSLKSLNPNAHYIYSDAE